MLTAVIFTVDLCSPARFVTSKIREKFGTSDLVVPVFISLSVDGLKSEYRVNKIREKPSTCKQRNAALFLEILGCRGCPPVSNQSMDRRTLNSCITWRVLR